MVLFALIAVGAWLFLRSPSPPLTGGWSAGPPMPGGGRGEVAAAAAGGKLYVFGGSATTAFRPVAGAYAFDLQARTWTQLPDMPHARLGAAAAAVDHKIYVVGGEGPGVGAIQVFDTVTGLWMTGAALPTPRDHLAVVAWDGLIYAIGGRVRGTNVADADVHDPARDIWERLLPMPKPRSGAAFGVWEGRIHVMGGEDPRTIRGTVYDDHFVYDIATKVWDRAGAMSTPRHGVGGAVVDGRFFAIGGATLPAGRSVTSWSARTEYLYLGRQLRIPQRRSGAAPAPMPPCLRGIKKMPIPAGPNADLRLPGRPPVAAKDCLLGVRGVRRSARGTSPVAS